MGVATILVLIVLAICGGLYVVSFNNKEILGFVTRLITMTIGFSICLVMVILGITTDATEWNIAPYIVGTISYLYTLVLTICDLRRYY